MYEIVRKEVLNAEVTLLEIYAPLVAKSVLPGQFIILRVDELGERIPLTVADYDRQRGMITVIFQKVGYTTYKLNLLQKGQALSDLVGPLGKATELNGVKKAVVIGGGLGVAIAYPQAKYLRQTGAEVDVIIGFRQQELIILQGELAAVADRLVVMTDDGSNGRAGFVTTALAELLAEGADYDVVLAIGPLPMMRAVSDLTRPAGIKTVVSMNSLMIDGTGMCGCCRLTVGGETRFACVDGPDFDGHLVDYGEAISRAGFYRAEEKRSLEHHSCRLKGE